MIRNTILILVLVFGCSPSAPPEIFPYNFVNAKEEKNGKILSNLELYAYEGEFDLEQLKRFVKKNSDRMDKMDRYNWYFIAIFNTKEKAKFPKAPLTAAYGLDDNTMKNIRVYYTYNRMNGFKEINI
ncbi:hypothetical protein [Leptospira sp. GIMC2001]|uniref:hypothetical protein n=1 Tax=Leptospira sp. GIMC2001 TaxID=1513297 RepID=UPI00234901AC|nr:hypothetical protein [Leptospira sp. GIMC2001]WCL50816.1 hypothetical protein O4O04_08390 [Leptospira sp. GIMC2001]